MTREDRLWIARMDALFGAIWRRWVQPPGQRIRVGPLRVYVLTLRVHHWLWRRGVKV